jgi:adenine deaminase
MSLKVKGNLVDVFNREIYPARISVGDGKIESVTRIDELLPHYILPGFIDSHVHIESSMLTPVGFSRLAVRHGTVAVVSDPHEIANVAGSEGVEFMIENSRKVPLKFFFGAPSCVPATVFENSGAVLDSQETGKLLRRGDIYFLSEVMNFPGVIDGDPEVLKKIEQAIRHRKPIDGHAPGLTGNDLKKYINTGISTDHECLSLAEAEEKINLGMKIQIREGSAAKGFDLLYELIDRYPDFVMLCSDDIHPGDLVKGHINQMISRGIKLGVNIFNLLRAASINPVKHYNLPVGMLRAGDHADFVIVDNLDDFGVIETYIDGEKVFSHGEVLFKGANQAFRTKFRTGRVDPVELKVKASGSRMRVIRAMDGELYTGSGIADPLVTGGYVVSDTENDILKITVVNKYENKRPVTAFVSGFGLKKGAIAGSIAHDSHNIICVGVSDDDIAYAINGIIDLQGGLIAVSYPDMVRMKLEIAGLMTVQEGADVAALQMELDNFARQSGCFLTAPFMTLSFMALLVIPELKISDQGLFDGINFSFTSLFAD